MTLPAVLLLVNKDFQSQVQSLKKCRNNRRFAVGDYLVLGLKFVKILRIFFTFLKFIKIRVIVITVIGLRLGPDLQKILGQT